MKVKRSHETGDDPIEDPPGELSRRRIARVTRVAAEVEHERGRATRRRDLGACRFEGRERLDEEMPKLSRAMPRRRVDSALGPVRRDMRGELMTMWNTENVMERPRVGLGVSTELQRQPSVPYGIVVFLEDAHRFGRCFDGPEAELVQPVLERSSPARDRVAQFGLHLSTRRIQQRGDRTYPARSADPKKRLTRYARSSSGSSGEPFREAGCGGTQIPGPRRAVWRESVASAGREARGLAVVFIGELVS